MKKILCPDCLKDISDNQFSIDSEVSGCIDIGYDCDVCKIEVYTLCIKHVHEDHEGEKFYG